LPPVSTTPTRSPGTAPAATAAIAIAEVGSISSFVVSQTSAIAARAASSSTSEMPAHSSLSTANVRSPSCTVRAPSAIVAGA
jgi:hypothetical protein